MVRTAYLSHLQVQATHANRGNVAIIVWNTLEAPYVWDVTTTEYEGTINLGNSTRSLLSIYFRDFVAEYDNENGEVVGKYLKEAEYVEVTAVPSTNGDLGENQFTLVKTDDTDKKAYDALIANIQENKKPRGTDDEEWTTVKGDKITAYAPIFDNLDTYFGKIVTVIFGKDNEVVSIRVIDETVENEYLTAYDATSSVSTFTIGGTKYKFAKGADVYANTIQIAGTEVDVAADDAIVTLFDDLGIKEKATNEYKDFTKVIKANVSLNSKNKVTRLDLFVSGTYDDLKTVEGIVTKVRNEKITIQYFLGEARKELVYDFSDLDEDELPRVIKDGKIASIEDIEVGNVLTYYYDNDMKDLKTVYVSEDVVTGEITRAKKTDLRIYTEEDNYVPSMGKIFLTDDKLTDAEPANDANSLVGENVELYLNIYGEYVLAVVDDVNSGDWNFGYIKAIKEFKQVEDGDDYEAVIRMLLEDGTTSSRAYKITADEEDVDKAETFLGLKQNSTPKTGFVAFKASGEAIEWDEIIFIDETDGTLTADTNNDEIENDFRGDYEIIPLSAGNAVNDTRKRIYESQDTTGNNYKFVSSSIIYNVDEQELGVSTKWGMLVKNDNGKKLNADTLVIVEKDEEDILYAIIDVATVPSSDAMYALVAEDHTKVKENGKFRYYLKLFTDDSADAETIYAENTSNAESDVKKVEVDSFVEYILADDEIETIKELVKLVEFAKLNSDEAVEENEVIFEGEETKLPAKVTLVPSGTPCSHENNKDATECNCIGFTSHEDAVYTVTSDSSVNSGKTYYTENAGVYTEVSNPQGDELATYYELTTAEVDAVHGTVIGTVKANFRVVDTEDDLLKYEDKDTEVEDGTEFGELEIDEDAIIYDARKDKDGKILIKTMTFSDLAKEVDEAGVYVIPFYNNDLANDADANILVVVD